jgi:hypothetical protein
MKNNSNEKLRLLIRDLISEMSNKSLEKEKVSDSDEESKEIKDEDLNERGLAFNEKTLTPRSDGSDLPHHAPVTTNKPHPNRKSRFK